MSTSSTSLSNSAPALLSFDFYEDEIISKGDQCFLPSFASFVSPLDANQQRQYLEEQQENAQKITSFVADRQSPFFKIQHLKHLFQMRTQLLIYTSFLPLLKINPIIN